MPWLPKNLDGMTVLRRKEINATQPFQPLACLFQVRYRVLQQRLLRRGRQFRQPCLIQLLKIKIA